MNLLRTAVLIAGMTLAVSVQAQSAAAGLSSYNVNCQSCHGTPPNLRDGAELGAGNAALIRTAITRDRGGMGYLSAMTDTELLDIATYLANPAAASTPVSTVSSADRILNWVESLYAALLQSNQTSAVAGPYTYRCYAAASLCIGMDTSQVYLYELNNPARGVYSIGALGDYLVMAQSYGF
ncbi:MAG: cytochrome c [Sulfurisoma sp.]|nr:cytochrome c [Sulfurisoma sp.]